MFGSRASRPEQHRGAPPKTGHVQERAFVISLIVVSFVTFVSCVVDPLCPSPDFIFVIVAVLS